jgi:glycosyltransferase involved in cell wall biosynthesis
VQWLLKCLLQDRQRAQLERRFARYKTQFVGYLHGEELAAAYASADAFVYASETETMGNVVLEAMASGLPVIAAKAGGVTSLIQHGIDGFLFSPRNADEAAGYVREVLQVPKRHQQMSAAALASVQTRTWQTSGDEVRSHYQQIIDEFAESPAAQKVRRKPGTLAALATNLLVLMCQLTAPRLPDTRQIAGTALKPKQVNAGI